VDQTLERFAATDPAERVLLLSTCLRPSETCPGKMQKQGMVCPPDCHEPCVLGRLQQAAQQLGYKGVCIAAGGAMALRFVADQAPRGIVAVACHKELAEGIEAVQAMSRDPAASPPAIVTVPLLTDGCVNTQVDENLVLQMLGVGCQHIRAAGAPLQDSVAP